MSEVIGILIETIDQAPHDLDFIVSKALSPSDRSDRVDRDIQKHQVKEVRRDLKIKIGFDHRAGKQGTDFPAPHDPIEFFPRIADVPAVKIQDDQLTERIQKEIADVIIAVLKSHGSTIQFAFERPNHIN